MHTICLRKTKIMGTEYNPWPVGHLEKKKLLSHVSYTKKKKKNLPLMLLSRTTEARLQKPAATNINNRQYTCNSIIILLLMANSMTTGLCLAGK